MTLKQYTEISSDVWNVFKKYLPNESDLNTFTADVAKLDKKYHDMKDLEAYRFMQKLLKVYFEELTEVKG